MKSIKYLYIYLMKLILTIFVDLIAFYCTLLISYLIRKDLYISFLNIQPLDKSFTFFIEIWWLPLLLLLVLSYERLYTRKYPFWYEVKILCQGLSLVAILMMSFFVLLKKPDLFPRSLILLVWGFSLIIFPSFRYLIKTRIHRFKIFREKTLFIGSDSFISSLKELFESERYMGYEVVGYLNSKPLKNKIPYLGKLKQLESVMANFSIQHIMLTSNTYLQQSIHTQILKKVKKLFIIPNFQDMPLYDTEIYYLFTQQFFLMCIYNKASSKWHRFLKRTFDTIFSFFILLSLLPIFIFITIAIKLTSQGPIFYKQKRQGYKNKSFYVYKFRTMYQDAEERLITLLKSNSSINKEWKTHFKLKKDPRITWFGQYLRRFSLDELPQFINILKGDMSVIGPRPVTEKELTNYYKNLKDYYLTIHPGLSGLWQISGRNDISYDLRIKLDTWYIINQSIWLDIVIIIKTLKIVLIKKGAY